MYGWYKRDLHNFQLLSFYPNNCVILTTFYFADFFKYHNIVRKTSLHKMF